MTAGPSKIPEWRVEVLDGESGRQRVTLIGPGTTFGIGAPEDANALAAILNAQAVAIRESQEQARRYDCGKSDLARAAMVACANLPDAEECLSCRLTRANWERNRFCVCIDDDDFPSIPAEYCPVHGNTYRYVVEQQSALVRAEARAAALEAALRHISALEGAGDAASIASRALA